ncbi:MAG: ABC transporter substrate-binding protein, partial [Pseudomonadota bacterium]
GLREKVSQISSALGLEVKAQSVMSEIDQKLSRLAVKRNAITQPKSVLFILAARDGRAIVGGKDTSADAVIKLAGAENAVSTIQGFKPLTDEALIAASPDTIIVMKRGDGSKSYEEAAKLPGVRLTPAGKSKRVHVMDGVYLIGFGPRMPDAASDLMAKVYGPEATGLVKKDIN